MNAMTLRSWLASFTLIALAGCQPVRDAGSAPSPPEAVAEATPPDTSGRDPQAPATYQVKLDTTEGEVVIDIDRSQAPRGADRFYRLVKEGYYDGAKFFRVVEGFVVQFGMAGDPELNTKWDRAMIRDDPVRGTNAPGTVTFATSGPNSRTTQIFINLGENTQLDGMGFSPFGRVTKGMDLVKKFHAGYGESPQQPLIAEQGNAYLEKEFPELDAIRTATVISEDGKPVEAKTEPKAEAAPAETPATSEETK